MMKKISCNEVERAVVKYFSPRKNLIIPNVSWGFGVHECDLLIVSKAGYCIEVEIKISVSDTKKDVQKYHNHKSDKIKYLYFAVPDYILERSKKYIPERAGIIIVKTESWCNELTCNTVRLPKPNKATPLTIKQRYDLARLGSLRIWGLKEKIIKLTKG